MEKTTNNSQEKFFKTDCGKLMIDEISNHLDGLIKKHSPVSCIGIGLLPPYAVKTESAFKNVFWATGRFLRSSPWPEECRYSKSLVTDEHLLPFKDDSVDLILIVHGMELALSPEGLLREAFRVLKPNSYACVIAAHKFGFLPFAASDLFPWNKLWLASTLTRKVMGAGFEKIKSKKIVDCVVKMRGKTLFLDKIFKNVIALEAQKTVLSPIESIQPTAGRLEPFGNAT
ncbi:MAG: class I SAM-dependent methyltransferase [Holosporales bacterium]|nr:class I SAM-dependent methyltransferase [Holosporales bacterium]